MEWYFAILVIFGSLILLMGLGFHVAVAFLVINVVGAYLLWGGTGGLNQLVIGIASSVTHFTLVTVPLFVLMGEVMFHSDLAPRMLEAIERCLGRIPGRLCFVTIGGGTVFAALTGESMASVAMLGSAILPDMEKRGYHKEMSLGTIMASGTLAVLIPPSTLAVVLGAIGEISIGGILLGIILPGLLLAFVFASYVLIKCKMRPGLAPAYSAASCGLSEKLVGLAKYVLPSGFVIFMVIGFMLLGIATATEAAASGALGMMGLAALYKRLSWRVLQKSVAGTVKISAMVFLIIAGAAIFSNLLAISGGPKGLLQFAMGLNVPPIFIIIAMQFVLLFLGMFIEIVSIMMITLPLFVPLVAHLGYDPIWFGVVFLMNVNIGSISPPFGLCLFVMKAVSPEGTTMKNVYNGAIPFVLLSLATLALVVAFPQLALWLPSLMR